MVAKQRVASSIKCIRRMLPGGAFANVACYMPGLGSILISESALRPLPDRPDGSLRKRLLVLLEYPTFQPANEIKSNRHWPWINPRTAPSFLCFLPWLFFPGAPGRDGVADRSQELVHSFRIGDRVGPFGRSGQAARYPRGRPAPTFRPSGTSTTLPSPPHPQTGVQKLRLHPLVSGIGAISVTPQRSSSTEPGVRDSP